MCFRHHRQATEEVARVAVAVRPCDSRVAMHTLVGPSRPGLSPTMSNSICSGLRSPSFCETQLAWPDMGP